MQTLKCRVECIDQIKFYTFDRFQTCTSLEDFRKETAQTILEIHVHVINNIIEVPVEYSQRATVGPALVWPVAKAVPVHHS